MKHIFLFALLLMVSFSLQAQSTTSNKSTTKTQTKKPDWVVKGAKVFNKTQVKQQPQVRPQQVQAPVVNSQARPQQVQPPVTNTQVRPQQVYAPVTNTQARPQQVQPTTTYPQARPTARVISVPQQNYNQNQATSQAAPNSYTTNNVSQFEMRSMAVVESQEYMSQGSNNSLSVEVEGADSKLARKVWQSFIQDNYNVRVKKVKKEQDYLADNINIGFIGSGAVDLYARAEDRGNAAKMMVWIDMGGKYLSSTEFPSWYATAQDVMYEYQLELKRELVRIELAEEEKNLKKLQAQMKRLQSAQDRYYKTIQEAEKRIAKAKSDIESNTAEQGSTQELIAEQIHIIEQVNIKLSSIQ